MAATTKRGKPSDVVLFLEHRESSLGRRWGGWVWPYEDESPPSGTVYGTYTAPAFLPRRQTRADPRLCCMASKASRAFDPPATWFCLVSSTHRSLCPVWHAGARQVMPLHGNGMIEPQTRCTVSIEVKPRRAPLVSLKRIRLLFLDGTGPPRGHSLIRAWSNPPLTPAAAGCAFCPLS